LPEKLPVWRLVPHKVLFFKKSLMEQADFNSKLERINGDIELQTFSNTIIKISSLYENTSGVILFCLSSVACPMCKRMTNLITTYRQTFLKYNIKLYCIANQIAEFNKELWLDDTTILINPKLELYQELGHGKLRKINFFNKAIYSNCYQSYNEGYSWSGGFFAQNSVLGGTLLLSNTGEVIYESQELIAGDMPDCKQLLEACEGLHNQEQGEEQYKQAFGAVNLMSLGFDFSKVT
jgi:hypothetical protein